MSNFFSRLTNCFSGNKTTTATTKNQRFKVGERVVLKENHSFYEEWKDVTYFEIKAVNKTGYDLYHPALYSTLVSSEYSLLANDDELEIFFIKLSE